MPHAAPRPCNYPGCRAVGRERYCEAHQRKVHARQNQRRREDPVRAEIDRRYWTARWRRMRDAHINEHPCCAECEREGRVTAGTVVDHVVPTASGGAMFDVANLQTLCDPHHRAKSARETFGRTG